jgi:quercetin dioxygenase-like cupin family protein
MEQSPEIVEFVEEKGGIYFRSILIPKAHTWIPQHVHDEDHATLCGQGSAALYVDGEFSEKVEAGRAVEVKAGKLHSFRSLVDETRLSCVWSLEKAERLKAKGF